MRVIIAGSRNINDYNIVQEAIQKSGFKISTVVSGGAKGVDKLGEKYALDNNLKIDQYIPDWRPNGKDVDRSAGYKRNIEMAKNADALIAIWDGESRGTKHMIIEGTKIGLNVYVHTI